MPAFWVVKHLDVMENILPGLLPICIGLALDPLALEQLKEALRYRIIVAVTAPTHTRLQIVCAQKGLPVVAAELATLIRMHQHFPLGASPSYRHEQGIEG